MKRKQNNNALLKKVFVPAALLLSGSVTSNANNMTNTDISSNSAILPVHNMNMTNSAILPTSEKTSADFSSYLASSTPYANKIIDIFEFPRYYHNLSDEDRQFFFQEGKDIFFEDLLSGKLKKSFLDLQRRRMDFIKNLFSRAKFARLTESKSNNKYLKIYYNTIMDEKKEYDMLEYTKIMQLLDAFIYLNSVMPKSSLYELQTHYEVIKEIRDGITMDYLESKNSQNEFWKISWETIIYFHSGGVNGLIVPFMPFMQSQIDHIIGSVIHFAELSDTMNKFSFDLLIENVTAIYRDAQTLGLL